MADARPNRASTNLSLRGSIAYDITQLAACVRAFAKCEKKNRGAVGLGYECESGEPLLAVVMRRRLIRRRQTRSGDRKSVV